MGNSLPPAAPPPPGDHRKNCSLMVLWQLTKKETQRVCKRKESSNIMSLPDDLLFEILVLVPPEDICKGARFVCKKWYNIIHTRRFLYALLHSSSPGRVARYLMNHSDHTDFWTMTGCYFEEPKMLNIYKYVGSQWAGCDGLKLESYYSSEKKRNLHVINPFKKQSFAVPLLCTRAFGQYNCNYSGVAYAAASRRYKVVQPYSCGDVDSIADGCAVLTLGVDSYWRQVRTEHCWRQVRTEHLSPTAKKLMCRRPLTTEGFIHWVEEDTYVLTLNIETEIFSTETPVPRGYGDINLDKKKYYLTGRSLHLFIPAGEFSFEAWDMKSETGEWTESDKIDLGHAPHNKKFLSDLGIQRLVPIAWLEIQRKLILHQTSRYNVFCICYYAVIQEIIEFCGSEYSATTQAAS